MPTVSKAQQQCVNKYIKNNYDDIKLSALICRLLSNEMGIEIGGVLKTVDNKDNNL